MSATRLVLLAFCLSLVGSSVAAEDVESVGTREIQEQVIMLPGDVPLVMVKISAGTFMMGSPETEQSRFAVEGPQTEVTISQDYVMGKYPVTQAQWAAVMGAEWSGLNFPGRPNNPVERVTWNDAQNFITTLNAYILSSGQGSSIMRLPTEAEWEYAARAGTTTRFSFGDSIIPSSDPLLGDWCENDSVRTAYMWYCNNGGNQTQPVGQKLSNPWGLYDMHGNVWEWCQDWYADSYPGGSVTDPTGPATGFNRVQRGGSYMSGARDCRSASRSEFNPGFVRNNLGFRLAGSVESVLPPGDQWMMW